MGVLTMKESFELVLNFTVISEGPSSQIILPHSSPTPSWLTIQLMNVLLDIHHFRARHQLSECHSY